MAEFSEAEKVEIVRALACFTAPSKIVADFKARGVQTDIRQIGSYDPTRSYFEAGPRWRDLFEATRKTFIEDLDSIPAASKAFRINLLSEAAMDARMKGNTALMAQHLKQIAEDIGGALTNRVKVGVDSDAADALTPDEKRAALARIFDNALSAPPVNAPSVATAQ